MQNVHGSYVTGLLIKHHTVLHWTVQIINYTVKTIKITVGLLFWMHTFPAESGGARRCSRSLATSRLPYLEATCRGVKPFCGDKKQTGVRYYSTCGGSFSAVDQTQSCWSSYELKMYHGVAPASASQVQHYIHLSRSVEWMTIISCHLQETG